MTIVGRVGSLIIRWLGSMWFLAFICVAAMASQLERSNEAGNGPTFATVGNLLQCDGPFCCTPGYRFELDGACGARVGILSELDLKEFVDRLVIVSGRIAACPPPPMCLCDNDRVGADSKGIACSGRDICLLVERIEEIDRCPFEVE